MDVFYAVLITIAACAAVFIPGGGYLGYKFGAKGKAAAEREYAQLDAELSDAKRKLAGLVK